jgi:hypothetical protein
VEPILGAIRSTGPDGVLPKGTIDSVEF